MQFFASLFPADTLLLHLLLQNLYKAAGELLLLLLALLLVSQLPSFCSGFFSCSRRCCSCSLLLQERRLLGPLRKCCLCLLQT